MRLNKLILWILMVSISFLAFANILHTNHKISKVNSKIEQSSFTKNNHSSKIKDHIPSNFFVDITAENENLENENEEYNSLEFSNIISEFTYKTIPYSSFKFTSSSKFKIPLFLLFHSWKFHL